MICFIDEGMISANFSFSTYSSYTSERRNVLIPRPSSLAMATCLSAKWYLCLLSLFFGYFISLQELATYWRKDMNIPPLTLPCYDLSVKERCYVRPASVARHWKTSNYIAVRLGAPFASQAVLCLSRNRVIDIGLMESIIWYFIWTWSLDSQLSTCFAICPF